MIGIIDYGMGNLHSVSKALERLGYDYRILSKPEELDACDGVILPGVGAFGDAMDHLREMGMVSAIRDYIGSGKPFLGICLGMQLLFESSEEHGHHEGLGILPGNVVRFQGDFKVPHMGWNRLSFQKQVPLFDGVEEGHVYFVHSYYVQPTDRDVLWAVTDYYGEVPAIVGRDQVCGMQFHPEKSGDVGMKLLDNFASRCGEVKA
ncbi:MAG: imidazole glycerol phosphate synthase subunit HisH [Bacillaceae bacterium]|nr:imidazole glycerol phosphate synthase subunit HisH [Bacillaceae bacterium]